MRVCCAFASDLPRGFSSFKVTKNVGRDLPVVIKNIKILLANRNALIADYLARSPAFNDYARVSFKSKCSVILECKQD